MGLFLLVTSPEESSFIEESMYICMMGKSLADGRLSDECKMHFTAIRDTNYILSGKWTVLLIAILATGKRRFLELQRIAGMGPKMLSKQLCELETNGLVSRTVQDTRPVTVIYELTEYGKTLKPITDEMARWGTEHRNKIKNEMRQKTP